MARPKKYKPRKAKAVKAEKSTVGGTRAKAGRKSVEVHFAALDAKIDQILALLHGEAQDVGPVTVAQYKAEVVSAVQAPVQVAVPLPTYQQPQLQPVVAQNNVPFQVSFIPPKSSQPDFAPPPLQQP